jgi:ABC-type dipeptide/oligopeptide/nickel transport system permease subunit
MFIIKNLVDNVPMVFFYVLIIMLLGDGFTPLLLIVILFGWMDFACVIRNNLMIIKSKDYNKVTSLYKVPFHKRIINNYLPPIMPILFNNIAICIPKIIALEILISYFGFSFGSSNPSLGMIFYSSIYSNTYFTKPYIFESELII